MSNEDKEVPWWEDDTTPEKQRETVKDLLNKIDSLKTQGQNIPRWYTFKQLTAIILIIFDGFLLYQSIGTPVAWYMYFVIIPHIVLFFDYMFTVWKIKRSMEETF